MVVEIEIEDDDMKSVKEGARYIGVSSVTLHRIMKRGEVGFFKIGSRIVFSREKHLIPFLLKNEIEPAESMPDSVSHFEAPVDDTLMPIISIAIAPETIDISDPKTNSQR